MTSLRNTALNTPVQRKPVSTQEAGKTLPQNYISRPQAAPTQTTANTAGTTMPQATTYSYPNYYYYPQSQPTPTASVQGINIDIIKPTVNPPIQPQVPQYYPYPTYYYPPVAMPAVPQNAGQLNNQKPPEPPPQKPAEQPKQPEQKTPPETKKAETPPKEEKKEPPKPETPAKENAPAAQKLDKERNTPISKGIPTTKLQELESTEPGAVSLLNMEDPAKRMQAACEMLRLFKDNPDPNTKNYKSLVEMLNRTLREEKHQNVRFPAITACMYTDGNRETQKLLKEIEKSDSAYGADAQLVKDIRTDRQKVLDDQAKTAAAKLNDGTSTETPAKPTEKTETVTKEAAATEESAPPSAETTPDATPAEENAPTPDTPPEATPTEQNPPDKQAPPNQGDVR